MVNYKSSSTIKPNEWDFDSSKYKVFHNTNIIEIPATEDTPLMYSYEVEEYARVEYLEYNDKIQNNIVSETDKMLVDLMYNITLLELGLTE